MNIYIVLEMGDYATTYGAYTTEARAEQRIKELYKNGLFGELEIVEDELIQEEGE